ncbi:MAG TPA: hypothetical protein DEB33_04255 [Gemmatimonadetes bacterium]|nr:hypothetical protein [Gemmatimonadota bacterium]
MLHAVPLVRRSALAALFLATLTTSAASLSAQDVGSNVQYPVDPMAVPRPVIHATRVEGPIVIDGILDDAGWAEAKPDNRTWIQTIPDQGMPASQNTILRIVYDDQNLYVSAVLFDEDTKTLSIPGLEQDFDTPNSDIFGVAIDTYLDRQNGFLWAVNPAGALWDAQAFNDQRDMSPAWEGVVDVQTSINDSTWVVEMELPFSTMRFNPVIGDQVWGINFSRRIRRRNEDAIWAPIPLQYRVYKFSLAGTLEGLQDLPSGRNLWIKPYTLGDQVTGARYPSPERHADVGIDAKWGLTPRMTLDLTVNTDFSQVEVDQEQVNLSRFSLFFPERRDFFLENEGTFGFQDTAIRNYRTGSSPRNFRLFNSRRIGLSSTRQPLPIAGGARLTGRIGDRFEVGLLDMQTRSLDGLSDGSDYSAENFAVARAKGTFGNATIGGMFINRQGQDGSERSAYNRSYGIDANVQLAPNVLMSGYWARTDDSSPVGSDANTGMFQTAWRNPFWNMSALFKHVGDGFSPETGFIDRTAVRRYFTTVGIHPQVNRFGIREINPYIDLDVYTDLDNAIETRGVEAGAVVSFLAGGQISASVRDRHERLFETTTIGGVPIEPGTYEWVEPSIRLTTRGDLPIFFSGQVQSGDFYDGSRTSYSADITFRPNEHVSLEVGGQRNDLILSGLDFSADIYRARLRYALNTKAFFLAFVQYNGATEELISNARINLIHSPLSDLFLVYTERRSLAVGTSERLLERGVTLKVTKLLAF